MDSWLRLAASYIVKMWEIFLDRHLSIVSVKDDTSFVQFDLKWVLGWFDLASLCIKMSPLSLELRRNWMETKHMVYAVRFITLLLFRRMVQIFLNFSSAVLEELYIGDTY